MADKVKAAQEAEERLQAFNTYLNRWKRLNAGQVDALTALKDAIMELKPKMSGEEMITFGQILVDLGRNGIEIMEVEELVVVNAVETNLLLLRVLKDGGHLTGEVNPV